MREITCNLCKITKPEDQFYRQTKTSKMRRCKSCVSEQNRLGRRALGLPEKRRTSEIGAPDTGFTCATCKLHQPSAQFRKHADGRWDYRCLGCLRKKTAIFARTQRGQFSAAKSVAKRRGIEFALSFEEFVAARSAGNCAYCGWPLPETSGGLDRKDHLLGYTVDNVVACCLECNLAKCSIFTHAEMLLLGPVIAEIKRLRKEAGVEYQRQGWGRPRKHQE